MDNIYRILGKERVKNILDNGVHQYYLSFPIRKKSGKKRWINAPMDELKEIQNKILYSFLYQMETHPCAIGFKPGISIEEGARKHVGQKVLLNVDLKNFFDTIDQLMVQDMFLWIMSALKDRRLINNFQTKEVRALAQLCTHKKRLPQGAPTSPAISNLVFNQTDRLIQRYALSKNLKYSRYADDLTLSHAEGDIDMLDVYLDLKKIIVEAGFIVNSKKTRIQRDHTRMSVTGIVVNDKPGVPKWKRKNFRAKLHNLEKGGRPITQLEKQQLTGYAQWIHQLNPKKGKQFLEQIGRLDCLQH